MEGFFGLLERSGKEDENTDREKSLTGGDWLVKMSYRVMVGIVSGFNLKRREKEKKWLYNGIGVNF